MRRILALAGVAVTALAAAGGVGATGTRLQVSPGSVARGGTITITGGPCREGETVILLSKLFPGHAYGVGDITTKSAADESFLRTFTVPRTKPAGTYVMTARCGGGNLGVVAHVRVTSATTRATLSVAPRAVHRGANVTFTGGPCIAGDTVFLLSKLFPGHAYGVGAITTKALADGSFSRTYNVPGKKAAGLYQVTARCGGGTLGVVARVRVK